MAGYSWAAAAYPPHVRQPLRSAPTSIPPRIGKSFVAWSPALTLVELLLLSGAGAIAGLINSVAGGGTIVSFPVAVALGLPPTVANATNAVALTPGSIASALAYRAELRKDKAILSLFLPPACLGAVVGAFLLWRTPQKIFDAIVPLLVLFATTLLLVQNLRTPKNIAQNEEWHVPQSKVTSWLLQLVIGIYGGYFGGGMGIMMLALLDRMGGAHIHRMNAVKSVLGAAINGLASVLFIFLGVVHGPAAAFMAVGAILGGFAGAYVARRIRPSLVRWSVVVIGFGIAATLAYRRWG
ncbi:MAG: sulfite exporter TauE/SafE family protein [Polyangiaceae bacterium]|nr:sulfite exporter TauE/SafE family protein [Polyangiaceae bacterium]